jgi:RNA polymerase sigma-70 factor (ECF subfamily)
MQDFEHADGAEARLIADCRDGRTELFAPLVERYRPRLVSLARRILGDAHIAEDVAQEALLRAHQNLARYETRAKFGTWLHQIAVNICRDQIRARQRLSKSFQRLREDASAGPARLPLDEVAPRILDAIHRLPVEYREVFILRHLQHVPATRVAEALGIEGSTVRSRLHRACLAMRDLLKPRGRVE